MDAGLTEMIPMVSEHGVMVALAAALIWQQVYCWHTVNKVLADLKVSTELQTNIMTGLGNALGGIQKSCDNTAAALGIINNTLVLTNNAFERHDRHADQIEDTVKETNTMLKAMRPQL